MRRSDWKTNKKECQRAPVIAPNCGALDLQGVMQVVNLEISCSTMILCSLIEKLGFDTSENESSKVLQKCSTVLPKCCQLSNCCQGSYPFLSWKSFFTAQGLWIGRVKLGAPGPHGLVSRLEPVARHLIYWEPLTSILQQIQCPLPFRCWCSVASRNRDERLRNCRRSCEMTVSDFSREVMSTWPRDAAEPFQFSILNRA